MFILIGVNIGYIFLMALLMRFVVMLYSNIDLEGMPEMPGMDIDFPPEMIFSMVLLASSSIFIAITVSIFIGGDHTFNTIRNKIISGNSREKIYLSSLTVSLIIGSIFFVINFVFSILGAGFAAGGFYFPEYLLRTILLFIPIYIAMISIMTFISLLLKSRAAGIGINIAIIFIIDMIASMIIMFVSTGSNAIEGIMMSTPHTFRNLLVAMSGSPLSDAGRTIGLGIGIPLIYFFAFTIGGVFLFRRKAIK